MAHLAPFSPNETDYSGIGQPILSHAHELYNCGDYHGCVTLLSTFPFPSPLTAAIPHPSRRPRPTDDVIFSVFLLLGASLFQLGDFAGSILYTETACAYQPDIPEPLSNLANAYKETGDVEKAITLYKSAISLRPDFPDAHGNLASLYLAQGSTEAAIAHYEVALRHCPENSAWHVDLGHLYRLVGRVADAKACFLNAINACPRFAIAWSNLACINKDERDIQSAINHYKKAIELDVTFIDAYSNLGNVYKEAGLLREAHSAYLTALQIQPDHAVVLGNLAAVQLEMGDIELALTTFQRALLIQPDFPDCLSNMGNALKLAGRLPEAVAAYHQCLNLTDWKHTDGLNNAANAYKDMGDSVTAERMYRQAIALRPTFAGARSNLGNLLKEQFKLEEALREYEAAIAADNNFADAWSNMGNCLKDLNRMDDAIRAYETAITIRPTFADAYGNLASVWKDTGQLEKAITYYRKALELREGVVDPIAFCNLVHCLQTVCDWDDRANLFARTRQVIANQIRTAHIPAVQPHHALVYPIPATDQLHISAHYAHAALRNVLVVGRMPYEWPIEAEAAKLHSRRRMRIGYVSSDLGNHPLSHLMQHVFTWHDTSIFEVFCYATSVSDGSEWRATIEAGVEHFKVVNTLPHAELAEIIRGDDLDILINLNGYTKGSRNEVFALRPAPIQLMYLGFPGSSGASYMHYFVTDGVTTPSNLSHLFTERLAFMPHCYFVNDHMQSYPDGAAELSDAEVNEIRGALGLPPRPAVVFCMFNQLYKIDPFVFACWMRILKRTPGSVLWLLMFPPAGEANIRREARGHGIHDSRLIFSPVAIKQEHIKRGRVADIFLDTPLCNAHTTGTDILWGGVPIVTLPGETLASRVAAALLTAMECPETIAADLGHYEELAVQLASRPEQLRELQAKIRGKRWSAPLFDTRRWCADWQLLLLAIVKDFRGMCARGIDPTRIIEARAKAAFANGDADATKAIFAGGPGVTIEGVPRALFDAPVPLSLASLLAPQAGDNTREVAPGIGGRLLASRSGPAPRDARVSAGGLVPHPVMWRQPVGRVPVHAGAPLQGALVAPAGGEQSLVQRRWPVGVGR